MLLGVASATLGLLPWLATGMRLPLQNLWQFDTMPEAMPIVLLPFSQYALTSIVGLVVVGSTVAGVVARALRRRMPRRGFAGLFAGVLAVQVVAVAQTAIAVQAGLQQRLESTLYLVALIALALFSIAAGALVLWLIARAPRAGALIGLAFGAIAVSFWASTLLHPFLGVATGDVSWLLGWLRWLPAVLIGAAIAWCGVGTVGRVVAAIASLVVLWIAPALATAVSNAVGTRVLATRPAEMLDYGVGVFAAASTMPEVVLPPIIVAIAVAVVGLAVRAGVSSAASSRSHHADGSGATVDGGATGGSGSGSGASGGAEG
ncbi:hypothetical protein ASE68_18145 [Agromyces sp. Leaf222]|nr:hypothetical protein ASE68_18145 [Agromyces sp. Leaf222]